MTYNTNVPNSAQSPALFPAQGSANFTRLKTLISANHKFNDTAAVDDGQHQNVQMLPIAVPGAPGQPFGQLFANDTLTGKQLCYKDSVNNLYQITPTMPIYAAVKFNGLAASPITGADIKFSYNVTNVTWGTPGEYIITFTNSLPSRDYVVFVTVQPGTNGTFGFGQSRSGTYNQAFDSTFTIVETFQFTVLPPFTLAQFQTVQVVVMGG